MNKLFDWVLLDPEEKSVTREYIEIAVLYLLFIGFVLLHEDVPTHWLWFSLLLLLGVVWKNTRELLRVGLVAGVIVFGLIRPYMVQAFYIPSRSMENTLLVNDHIFVNKFNYRVTRPDRWDIIVFEYPNNPKRDYIKRLVGLPGDTVSIRDEQLHVNGQPIQRRYLDSEVEIQFENRILSSTFNENLKTIRFPGDGLSVNGREMNGQSQQPVRLGYSVSRIYREAGDHRMKQLEQNGAVIGHEFTRDFGPIHIPKVGETIQLNQLSSVEQRYYFHLMDQWFEGDVSLDNGTGIFYLDGVPKKELTIQEPLYFAMGDNRDQSEDSRVWGFVPEHRLLGEAFFIYWPIHRVGLIGS